MALEDVVGGGALIALALMVLWAAVVDRRHR